MLAVLQHIFSCFAGCDRRRSCGVCGANPNVKAWGSGNVRGEEVDINGSLLSPATGTYGIVLENAGTVVEKNTDSVTGFLGDMAVNSNLECDEWDNLSNQLGSLGPGPNVLIIGSGTPAGTGVRSQILRSP